MPSLERGHARAGAWELMTLREHPRWGTGAQSMERGTWDRPREGRGTVGVSTIVHCTHARAKVCLGPHSGISDPKAPILLQNLFGPSFGRTAAVNQAERCPPMTFTPRSL